MNQYIPCMSVQAVCDLQAAYTATSFIVGLLVAYEMTFLDFHNLSSTLVSKLILQTRGHRIVAWFSLSFHLSHCKLHSSSTVILTIINLINPKVLYCTAPDWIAALNHPSAFCAISGKLDVCVLIVRFLMVQKCKSGTGECQV